MSKNDEKSTDIFGTGIMGLDKDSNKSESIKRYIKRVKIGEGGQGSVYKVFDSNLQTYRAMKFIHPQFSSNKEFVKNYKSEVNITGHLNYPNIVKVYDAGIEEKKLFILMDYVDGKILAHINPLPESIAAMIISRVADALNYAHNARISFEGQTINGIIHGDIKPENLLVNKDGEIMVMDFGLAKAAKAIKDFTSGMTFGTFAYAPPEQYNKEETDEKSDIYSLGVTLYKLITGKTGFENETQMSIGKKKSVDYTEIIEQGNIDDKLYSIISKATRYSRTERFENANELKEELDDFVKSNYVITTSPKNVIGAYFDFNIEPQPKLQEFVQKYKKKVKKRKSKIDLEEKDFRKKSFIKYVLLIVIPIVIIILAYIFFFSQSKYMLIIQNPEQMEATVFLEGSKIGELNQNVKKRFRLEQEGVYNLKIQQKDKQDVIEEFAITKQKKVHEIIYSPSDDIEGKKPLPKPVPIPIPPKIQYKIVIDNPQKLDGDVWIDGEKEGKLQKKSKSEFKLLAAGKYVIEILSSKRDDFSKTVNLTTDKKSGKINYDPSIYILRVNNSQKIKANVFVDGEIIKKISDDYEKKFYKSGEFQIKIEDKKGEFITHQQTVKFGKNNLETIINYNPPPKRTYQITIDNPNNLTASISVNNSEPEEFQGSYQNSYADPSIKTYIIKADGYKDFIFEVDFNEDPNPFKTYNPEPRYCTLTIAESPENANISLNGNKVQYQIEKGDIVIPDLEYGKDYTIVVTSNEYQDFIREFKTNKKRIEIIYSAPLSTGTIQFNPPLNRELLKNTKIWLDGKEIKSASNIPNLKPGPHSIRLYFQLENYTRAIEEAVNVKPLNKDGSNTSIIKLDVNFVQIRCPNPQTKVYVDNSYVGYTPLTIPFKKTSFAIIRVESKDGLSQEKTINPKIDENVVFKRVNEKAWAIFLEADEIITQYKAEQNRDQYQELLIEADSKLNKATQIDPTISEIYSHKMFIINEKLNEAIERSKRDLAISLVSQLDNIKDKALEYADNNILRSIINKNIGKGHFLYAYNFLKNQQQSNYLINKCLPLLEKFEEERRKKTSTDISFSQEYDLDDGGCHLAMCYQSIFEVNNDKKYKDKAKRIWKKYYFNPFTLRNGKVKDNPFKVFKKEWTKRLY